MHKCACRAASQAVVAGAEPRHRMGGSYGHLHPSWPGSASPSSGRDSSSLLFSYHGCPSPSSPILSSFSIPKNFQHFLPLCLLQPQLPSIQAEDMSWVHGMVSHHISSHLSALLCVVQCCHLFGCCCSLNIKLQQQQQSQGPRSWTKTHKTPWLSKVS